MHAPAEMLTMESAPVRCACQTSSGSVLVGLARWRVGAPRRGLRAALARGAGGVRTRLILVAGRSLKEPVARYGPFVMNTKEQIMQAFVDYQEGRL